MIEKLIKDFSLDDELKAIADKVFNKERITPNEGVTLFQKGDPGFLGALANHIRTERHGDKTYFNRNFHIEPTNVCVFDCKFCAYSRKIREKSEFDAWEMSEEEILDTIREYDEKPVTEVHIVGGVHPKMGLEYFAKLIRKIKKIRPDIHVKAFTAVELEYMCRKAKVSYKEGLQILKEHGQDSLPGGGAEIFHSEIRDKICKDKCSAEEWLAIHEIAHELGMKSNATILYGSIEDYHHRIHHLEELRKLQDKTGGFNTFIPLKFRNGENQMSDVPEVNLLEDIKMYAVSRIYLDNFNHIKAYWPMLGREAAQLMLNYGVNDIDGTIDDTTKIYSMAGAEEQSPVMTTEEIVQLIRNAGKTPVERGSLYDEIKVFKRESPSPSPA